MDQAQSQPDALSEGRRIYLGNLPYTAKPYDIEDLLSSNGFPELENIHISIDPVSARNPGYCFVDFPDSATASRALSSLDASIRGRQIKVGPCQPKKEGARPEKSDFAFDRWGNWNSSTNSRSGDGERNTTSTTGRFNNRGIEQGPHGALHHFDDILEGYEGRRLYVGGLGKMLNQAQHNKKLTELFTSFDLNPTAIGKRITPHPSTRSKPGLHHYCFVDFANREETNAARVALNGQYFMGGRLKVALAGQIPRKLLDRYTDNIDGERVHDVHDEGSWRPNNFPSRYENMTEPSRSMASSNWRVRASE